LAALCRVYKKLGCIAQELKLVLKATNEKYKSMVDEA